MPFNQAVDFVAEQPDALFPQISTIASNEVRGMIRPVGLLGKLMEITFVLDGRQRGAGRRPGPAAVALQRHPGNFADTERHRLRRLVVGVMTMA